MELPLGSFRFTSCLLNNAFFSWCLRLMHCLHLCPKKYRCQSLLDYVVKTLASVSWTMWWKLLRPTWCLIILIVLRLSFFHSSPFIPSNLTSLSQRVKQILALEHILHPRHSNSLIGHHQHDHGAPIVLCHLSKIISKQAITDRTALKAPDWLKTPKYSIPGL